MSSIVLNGNVAILDIPINTPLTITAKSNSPTNQVVTIKDGGSVNLMFSGSGERKLIGQAAVRSRAPLTATFQYSSQGGLASPKLNSGGPYSIGKNNFAVVVAENGDDNDYNDCILQIDW